MSQHISDALFQTTPTREQRAANSAAVAALNTAIANVPEPYDVECAHQAASELLALLAADPSERARDEHRRVLTVAKGMQSLDAIDSIMSRAQELVPFVNLRNPTALELVHDTALRENLTRMLGSVWTYTDWQNLGRKLKLRSSQLQAHQFDTLLEW